MHVELVVHTDPYGEVVVADEQGHYVQKGLGGVKTSLLPGRYYVYIRGIGYPVDLKEEAVFFEEPPSLEPDDFVAKNLNEETVVLSCFISRRCCPVCEAGILLGMRDK
jgi:hypothetical protein